MFKPRVVAIIQARMNSTRLPGKTLADIGGRTLLEHVIHRVRSSRAVDIVVVATSTDPQDWTIVRLAERCGVSAYAGSPEDVLDRFYQVARQTAADIVVRITADDPFKDPELIDKIIEQLLANPELDYVSNCIEPSYPEGLDVEAFRSAALEEAWREARLPSEREHVTPYIWKNADRFKVANIKCQEDLSHFRWTVDYPQDLHFAREVYARLHDQGIFGMHDILSLLQAEPKLAEINQGIERFAGYAECLKRDSRESKAAEKSTSMKRVGNRERDYVLEMLESQFRSSVATDMTERLEKKFAAVFQSKYAISFVNGTATMHSALAAAGISRGDEVIVPPLTMASTALAVVHAGGTPVFADVDPCTWAIDPRSIERCITSRTRAIIPVAIYGLAPEMDAIMEIAKRVKLFVLVDAAQCFLGYYRGQVVGSIGHASSFSFQSSKHMTCGEGGMVTTNDEELATRIRRFNSLGYAAVEAAAGKGKITKESVQDPNYERHVSIGWNYRMAELCAAVALAQLERLQELVETRRQMARLYAEAARECSWLIPQAVPDACEHSYWTWAAKLEIHGEFSWHDFRKKYMELGGDGIYAAWQLTYLEPAFRDKLFREGWCVAGSQKYERGLCPVAECVQPKLLQFKTNYWDAHLAEQKAEALARTIAHFGK